VYSDPTLVSHNVSQLSFN